MGKRSVLTTVRRMASNYELYLFLLPTVAFFAIFHYAPMYGIRIAFTNYKPGMAISQAPWVGLKNITDFVGSRMFWRSINNTVILSLYSICVGFLPPIFFALMLNQVKSSHFKKLVQNISYMPNFISVVVLVGMINAFFSSGSGIINQLIKIAGGSSVPFLTKAQYFRSLYVGSGVWQGMGWGAIVYLAALSGINPEFYEAATIDGATRFQKIGHIEIPSILPTVIILFILTVGNFMSVGFEKVLLMQQNTNLSTSEILSTYVYKVGLLNADYSQSTAINLFNSLINFCLLVLANGIAKRLSEVSLW